MMVRRGVKEDNLSQFCPAFAKLTTLFLFCVCDKYCQNFFGMHIYQTLCVVGTRQERCYILRIRTAS